MISEQITQGVERAPQRSLLYAAGFTEDEIKKPLIGVVSAQSEIIPGHMHLSKIAEAVKAGIYAAGGTPVVVPAIGGVRWLVMGHRGMHYSLASRELIADSVETLAARTLLRWSSADSQLRQDRTRHGHGSTAAEHSCHRLLRRADAGGTCQGQKDQPFADV